MNKLILDNHLYRLCSAWCRHLKARETAWVETYREYDALSGSLRGREGGRARVIVNQWDGYQCGRYIGVKM